MSATARRRAHRARRQRCRARQFPLGATRQRDGGHELRGRLRRRRRHDAVPVRRRRRGDPDPAAGLRRRRLARVRARASGPGRPTGTGSTGPYDPARGPALQPGQAAARPVRPGDQRRGRGSGRRCSATTLDDPDAPSTLDSAGARAAQPGRRPGASPGSDDARPRHRYADTVIYEVHVKGFTMRHPDVPPELRGTYAGLGHEAAIAHLRRPGRDRRRTAAGAPERARGVPARARA